MRGRCASALHGRQSQGPHCRCLDRLNINLSGRSRRQAHLLVVGVLRPCLRRGRGTASPGHPEVAYCMWMSRHMTGRRNTGERAQVVWLPPAFPLGEDWAEKDREAFNRESGWQSLLTRAADRLHAEVAGKADLEGSLDGPRTGGASLAGALDRLTQRKPTAQSLEPPPHLPAQHAHQFSRACTSHTLQHTITLVVTLRDPPLKKHDRTDSGIRVV